MNVKISPRIILLAALAFILVAVNLSTTSKANAQSWTLVWSDEFNGTGQPDATNWNYHVGNGRNPGLNAFDGWGNGEWEWYRPQNCSQSGGNLVMKAEYLDTPTNIAGRDWYQFSCRITSDTKRSVQFGAIEARIQLPNNIGTWPAFWMMGDACDDTSTSSYAPAAGYYDTMATNWSSCGEVDIMEHRNTESIIFNNLFWDVRTGLFPWAADPSNQSNPVQTNIGAVNVFRTYRLEWNATTMRWLVDGAVTKTQDITPSNMEEFQKPFHLIMNLALSGQFTGNTAPNKAEFPLYMNVDYVRVYSNGGAPIPTTTPAPPTLTPTSPAPATWTQVWSDEFNAAANTGANTTNWLYDLGQCYPGCPAANWGTGEIETMTNSTANVYHTGTGSLAIKAIRDGAGNWTSGRIETQRTDFAAPAGGQLAIEGRIQLPNVTGAAAQGYWPAFWTLGSPFRGVYTNWPSAGEMDIMENVNGLNQTFGTLHCGVAPGGPCNEYNGLGGNLVMGSPSLQSAYHTYRIELDKRSTTQVIRWYIDGVQYHSVNSSQMDATTWANATNHGFFVILNVAMGGSWPGGPTASTTSGAQMLVDYVRVFTSTSSAPTNTPGVPTNTSVAPTNTSVGPTATKPPATNTSVPTSSADFTQGVTSLNSTQAKIWFRPTIASAYVDVHYLINGGGQQNFRMTNNAGTWEQTVSGLATGTVVSYWFTYEKSGAQYDSAHFTYTHGGVAPTATNTTAPATATKTNTPVPPTATKTNTPAGDFTQGVTRLTTSSIKIWIKPTIAAAYVDVHYLINGGGQQNFRMTNNAGTWEQTVSGLATGTVVSYWFTYEKSGAQYDSAHYSFTN